MATNKEQVMSSSGVNILAGIWLIISPFVLGFSGTASATNAIVVGIIVGVLALIRAMSTENTAWIGWVNAILGVWLLLSSLFVGYATMGALWNSVILGIIVIVFSALSATTSKQQYA
jgi:hypothetical protein